MCVRSWFFRRKMESLEDWILEQEYPDRVRIGMALTWGDHYEIMEE